jgi:hypothetical protein
MEGNNHSHKHLAIIATTIGAATMVITFGPFILSAIQHYQSREQRALTKKLTILHIQEAEMRLKKLQNE